MARGSLSLFTFLLLSGAALAGELPQPPAATPEYDARALAGLLDAELPAATPETEPLADPTLAALGPILGPSWTADLPPSLHESLTVAPSWPAPSPRRSTSFDAPRPFKVDVGANVPTPPRIPYDVDPRLASTAGEVSGRIEYEGEHWQVYGTRSLGVTPTNRPLPALTGNLALGTFYKLPETLQGGRIGAGVDVLSPFDQKARLEYRHAFGSTEGFVSAERNILWRPVPEAVPVTAIRGGLLRKF